MFKKGDKVKISRLSVYFGHDAQLPDGIVGIVQEDQRYGDSFFSVIWPTGRNRYKAKDLVKVNTFKGNK